MGNRNVQPVSSLVEVATLLGGVVALWPSWVELLPTHGRPEWYYRTSGTILGGIMALWHLE